MEDEIIYEESKLPTKVKAVLFVVIFAVIIGGIIILFKSINFGVKKTIVYEVGDTISTDVLDYLTNKPLNPKDYKLNLDSVSFTNDKVLNVVGEYTYRVVLNDIIKEGKVIVKDTTAPTVSTNELTVGLNEEIKPDDFIAKCEDYSYPCTYEFDGSVDTSKEGTYTVNIKAKDTSNNVAKTTAKLIVKEGASLVQTKTKDMEPSYTEPDYGDWNKKYVITFSGAFNPDDEENYRWQYYYDFMNSNYNDYLDDKDIGKTVTSAEIIAVYNKYHYVIGFAARATLNDGTITYLTNKE
jgi:hypothetical protein